MAHSKSAIKRIKINQRNRIRNRIYKSSIKTVQKRLLSGSVNGLALTDPTVKQNLSLFYSLLDKSVKRGIFHKRTAARKKSNIVKRLKAGI